MSDEFYMRAQLVKNQVERLAMEAQGTKDLARLAELRAEMDECAASMFAIRAEQLIAYLPKPKAPRRRFWRRRGVSDV